MRIKGFTLIELLVVIAIIAILAAILFPIFVNAKERTTQVKCLANLKQLATATRMYADDNDGRLPSSWPGYGRPDWCGCRQTYDPAPEISKEGVIWRYTGKSMALYLCPSDNNVKAPLLNNIRNYPLSYSMNDSLHHRKVESIKGKPSRMLLFIHEARSTINDGNFNWWSLKDIPGDVHWGGTTLVYLDCHARHASQTSLLAERDAGWWDPGPK